MLFWDFTNRRMIITYRRFATTYLSNLQRLEPRRLDR